MEDLEVAVAVEIGGDGDVDRAVAPAHEQESAEVVTHPGDDGDTYSIAVRYVYEVGGASYSGDRYDFSIGSTSSCRGCLRFRHPGASA